MASFILPPARRAPFPRPPAPPLTPLRRPIPHARASLSMSTPSSSPPDIPPPLDAPTSSTRPAPPPAPAAPPPSFAGPPAPPPAGGEPRPGDGPGDTDGDGPAPSASASAALSRRLRRLLSVLSGASRGAASAAAAVVKTVPAPVLVALLSLLSTAAGARYKARLDRRAAAAARIAAASEKKRAVERRLRSTYQQLAAPILKSAAKLAHRLHALVHADESAHAGAHASPAYSAYLLGRYLAMVQIIKNDNELLDFGFPAADRVLANILARVQGVLCADDAALIAMQQSEHLFHPPPGQRPLRAGPLRVTPRTQTALGELLLRKLYSRNVDFVEKADNEDRGPRAVVSFLEFSRLLEQDDTLSRWYDPVIRDFARLENVVRRLPKDKRRSDKVGARLYFLQAGLLDLVEFFDPLPQALSIPLYNRRRLQLGNVAFKEEQRAPHSLNLLYRELANVRDHRVVDGSLMDRLRLPNGGLEVHVKAARTEKRKDLELTKYGDCPNSQRVLIVLEELGIPYQKVFIAPDSKPAWFYLLHPEKRTPVVYHDGNLVEDSKHIVSYVLDRFRPARGKLPLASTAKLKLDVGTAGFTRFHDHFVGWVSGDGKAKAECERELRELNDTLQVAQKKNETGVFLGGDRFAREDTAIAPMLNNVEIAGRAIKQWAIPDDCVHVKKYLEAARKIPSFAKTVGSDKAIIAGYHAFAEAGADKVPVLANMLE